MLTSTSTPQGPTGPRYGLVRVRENAESIAFYRGEGSEQRLLFQRLQDVVQNYFSLIVTSRNLEFFTSFYRCFAARHGLREGAAQAIASAMHGQSSRLLLYSGAILRLLAFDDMCKIRRQLSNRICEQVLKGDLQPVCRFLIQILPAAVVAPLYFKGKIEFGVINQSSSAFNHILSDVSLVVYQVLLPMMSALW